MATTLETLSEAIRAEVDGYHFYMMAAKNTDDPQGREVFERLAQDEVEHARFLTAQVESIKETGEASPGLTLKAPTRYKGNSPIFSEALKARVKEAHYEMSALSIGAQLELSAIQFYRGAADDAEDPEVAAFLNDLAAWEQGHYDALVAQQAALKDEYWAEGRFSPF
jgi:rubrerythrin